VDAVYYFAYGSCMSPEDLARDVEEFELIGPALVRGYRLGFTRYSRMRRGGVADLVPDENSVVEGVLYRLPVEQLPALDEREGAPEHYRREHVRVETPDGKVYDDVLTYVVVDKAAEEIPPHADYVQTILRGAEAYLSRPYVEQLRECLRQMAEKKPQGERERPSGKERAAERDRRREATGARRRRRRRVRRRVAIVLRRLVG